MKAKESDTSRGGEDGANDCSDTWRRGRGARARALRRCCLLLSAACLVFLFQGFASLQRCGRCPGNEISICEAIVISLGFGTVNADNGPAFESRGFEFESTERGKSGFLSGPSESGGKRQSKGSGKRSEVAVRRNEGSGTEEVSGTDRISGTKPVSGTEPISEMARVRDPALRVSDGKGLARNQSGTEERNNQTAESVGSGLENRSDTQENGMEGVSVAVTAGTAAEAETETKRQSLTANSQQFSGTSDPAGLRDPGIERTTKSVVLRETARVSTQNSSQGQDASLKRQGLSDGRGQNNESAKVGDLDEASGLRGQTRPRSTLHRTNSSLPRVSNFTVPSNASRRWLNLASGKNWAEESSSAKSRPRLAKLNLTAVLKRSESGDSKPAIPSPQNAGAENAWSRRSSGNSVSRRVEKPPSQVPLAAGVNRLSERFREAGVSGNRQKPRPFRGDVNGLLGKRLVAGVNGLSRETSEPWVLRPSKIAFMFLANGRIHTDRIWDRFFRGAPSKDHYSIYIHSNLGPGFEYNERTTNASCFYGRTLPNSAPSLRFHISMVDAQTKLLRSALQDASNQWFVLLSDSCVPLHSFAFTYNYLFAGTKSFVDSRYLPPELDQHLPRWTELLRPEVSRADFRKGSQWMTVTRKHASMIAYDERFYDAFARKPWNCQDEHYVSTMLPLLDLHGLEERTLTYVDWRNDGCPDNCGSPRPFNANKTSNELLHNISAASNSPRPVHFFWNEPEPCLLNGHTAPCYLFARKFAKDSIDKLLHLLPFDEGGEERKGKGEMRRI